MRSHRPAERVVPISRGSKHEATSNASHASCFLAGAEDVHARGLAPWLDPLDSHLRAGGNLARTPSATRKNSYRPPASPAHSAPPVGRRVVAGRPAAA